MRIIILFMFLMPNLAFADTLIGFRGANGAFDTEAFHQFTLTIRGSETRVQEDI
jgi:hypothetical protein